MRTLKTILFFVLLLWSFGSYAQSNVVPDADEFAALKALWENTGGASWTTKTNWPTAGSWPSSATAATMGTWYGITVTNGDVQVINLSSNNLTGSVPEELNKLKKLRVFQLSTNGLRGIPEDLTGLTNLESFFVGANSIEGPLPTFATSLPNLGYLVFPFNRFYGAIPSSYGGYGHLGQLILNDNKLTGSLPPSLGSLGFLTLMQLQNNQFSGSIPTEFSGLTKLQTLYLYNNKLSGAIPSSLSGMTKIVWFYLHSNQFSGTVPPIFSTMNDLYGLSLQNNKFSGTLPSLRGAAIDVSNNNFTGTFPSMTASAISVNASGNGFTGLPSGIASYTALTVLNFQSNELVSIPSGLSSHPNKANLQLLLQNNRLDFSAIRPLTGFKSTSVRVPQKNVRDVVTQVMTTGSALVITARPPGSGTTLTWEKQIGNGGWTTLSNDQDTVKQTYTRTISARTDEGVYRWKTTNSSFSGTTITSDPMAIRTVDGFTIDNWAFQYRYDGRKRMTHKKVPGADWVYMVYDDRDRLVMIQDGEQRKLNKWMVTKYDALNRPVITALYTHNVYKDQKGMDSLIHKTNFTEAYSSSGALFGYSNTVFPTTNLELLTVTYYDNYEFLTGVNNFGYKTDQLTDQYKYNNAADTSFPRTLGNVTGSRIKSSSYPYWMLSANYYDDKGRVIQTVNETYKAGVDRITTNYDFIGKVIATKTSHTVNSLRWDPASLANVRLEGNAVVRVAGGATWGGSGVSSVQTIPASTSGWAEGTVSDITTARYFGLCDNDSDKTPNTIDYAFYMNVAALQITENGVLKYTVSGGQAVGDKLRIERTGTTVKYYKNGAFLYQSLTSSSTALKLDLSLGSSGATILNLNLSSSKTTRNVKRDFEYDHAGRLIKTWHKIDDDDSVLLVKNEYNELGQLIDKKLHSTDGSEFEQSVDYDYNIRGWLVSMNGESLAGNSNDNKDDLFDMDLFYNKVNDDLDNTALFNGNISAMRWKSLSGDAKAQSYLFDYDAMNRLTDANRKTYNSLGSIWATSTAFNEKELEYDLNGNITRLKRTGKGGAVMDDLQYGYGESEARSNRLMKVTDGGDVLSGFVDDRRSADDYNYDQNGNMIADNNKGIGIIYNHLNLPTYVGKTSNESIIYIYDSQGRKVSQIVRNASGLQTKVTDYEGEFIYENDTLKFINHEEGRVIVTGAESEYQYHLKDHLGNVRLTFTATPEVDEWNADYEADTGTQFEYYNEAVRINSEVFDHTNVGSTHYSGRLNGTLKERFGLAKSLKVMPGDIVRAEVYAKYLDPDTAWVNGMPAFINSIVNGTAPAGTFKDGGLVGSTGGVLMPFWALFADDRDDDPDDAPKAYLNWLVFDNDYNLIDLGADQISRDGREYGQDGSHDKLFKDLTIGQAGYVYLYVSNDHYELEGEVVEVYWDDFKVEHVKSPVISSQDYYPFGLTFNASQREGSSPQGFLYQEKELQDELNVNLYDFEWRQYDPLIGRTTSMDAHADSYHLLSPYSWVANNPLSLIDPDGQDYTEAEIAAHYEGLSAQVFAMELQARSEARKPPVLSFNSKNRERREAYNQAVKDLGPPPNSTDLILAGVGTAGFIAETQAVIIRSSRAGYTSGKLFSSSPAVYSKKTARSVSLGAKVVGMGLTFWGIYNTERQFRSGQIDEGRRRLSHLNNGVGALFPRMALPLAVGDYLGQKYHNEIINDVTQPGGILFDLTRTTLEFLGIPIEAKPKK